MPKGIQLKIKLETARFNRALAREVIPSAKVSAKDVIRTTSLELMGLTMGCWPVKSGRSRAAWRPIFLSLGVPPPLPKGNNARAQLEGQKAGRYIEKDSFKGFTAFMVNGVDYSIFLEGGSSGQAPTGCLRNSMQLMRRNIQRGKRRRQFMKGLKGVR